MAGILEDLYNGNLCPSEDYAEMLKNQSHAAREKNKEMFDAFRSGLTAEQQALFQKLMDLQLETLSLEHAAAFSSGFRLGAKIMLEVLDPPK